MIQPRSQIASDRTSGNGLESHAWMTAGHVSTEEAVHLHSVSLKLLADEPFSHA